MVMIGVILFVGVVVNNVIVFIDFIKIMRIWGYDKDYLIIYFCEIRLRFIFMIIMIIVFGMIFMVLGLGEGFEFYRGMVIIVIFGLLFLIILILVLIFILYLIVDSFILKLMIRIKVIFCKFKKKEVK